MTDIFHEFSEIYDSYAARYKCKSAITQLSMRSGVAVSTIRRFAQHESVPNFENCISIMSVMLTKPELLDFTQRYFPKVGRLLVESSNQQGKFISSHDDASGHLSSETGDLIYNLASTKSGVTETDIKRLRGEHGLRQLDELVSSGEVEKGSDGAYRLADAEFSIWDSKLALKCATHDIERFDRALIGTSASAIVKHVESVNKDGLDAIKNEIICFSQKIAQIRNNPRYQGNIPFYVSALYNLLDTSKFTSEEDSK